MVILVDGSARGGGGGGGLGYREEDYVTLCEKRERAGRGGPA